MQKEVTTYMTVQPKRYLAIMEIETFITNYGKNKQRIMTPKWCKKCKSKVFRLVMEGKPFGRITID